MTFVRQERTKNLLEKVLLSGKKYKVCHEQHPQQAPTKKRRKRSGDMNMKLSDDLLDRLGIYFVHQSINVRYGITFEKFVELHQSGAWIAYLA